eukprot:14160955-Alexandrium_andersonii.AAC.1
MCIRDSLKAAVQLLEADQQHEASEDTYQKVAALFKTNTGAAKRLAEVSARQREEEKEAAKQ